MHCSCGRWSWPGSDRHLTRSLCGVEHLTCCHAPPSALLSGALSLEVCHTSRATWASHLRTATPIESPGSALTGNLLSVRRFDWLVMAMARPRCGRDKPSRGTRFEKSLYLLCADHHVEWRHPWALALAPCGFIYVLYTCTSRCLVALVTERCVTHWVCTPEG